MTFEERLILNRRAYELAKKDNKNLNIEVATRNNKTNIIVANYSFSTDKSPNKVINPEKKKLR